MVSRLAKSAVPPNTQMARDAQWAVLKSATVFVNYLASKYVSSQILSNKRYTKEGGRK